MKKYKNMNSLIIPAYISCRSYKVETPDSTTFIVNERTKKPLILEGLSSDLWYKILENTPAEKLDDFIAVNDLQDEFDDFIDGLIARDLLIDTISPTTTAVLSSFNLTAHNNKKLINMKLWAWKQGYLYSALLETTYRCNQRCIHCFNPDAHKRLKNEKDFYKDELTTQEFKNIIDELFELGCFTLILSGGEICLRKDFLELVEYVRSKRIRVEVSTNCIALNDDIIDKLASLWIAEINTTLFSANPELHDYITKVPGSFDKTINAFKKLIEKRIEVTVKTPLMKHTAKGYKETVKLLKDLGVKRHELTVFITHNLDPENKDDPFNCAITNEGEQIVILVDPDAPAHIGDKKEINEVLLNEKLCKTGHEIIMDPYGNIKPCPSHYMVVDNIRNSSLKEIWKSKELEKCRNRKRKDFNSCNKHDYCSYCLPCASVSGLETGIHTSSSDLQCKQAKIRMKADEFVKNEVPLEEIRKIYNLDDNFGHIL